MSSKSRYVVVEIGDERVNYMHVGMYRTDAEDTELIDWKSAPVPPDGQLVRDMGEAVNALYGKASILGASSAKARLNDDPDYAVALQSESEELRDVAERLRSIFGLDEAGRKE